MTRNEEYFRAYDAIRQGNLYTAKIEPSFDFDDEYPVKLWIVYVDLDGRKHPEYTRHYKTAKAAYNRMTQYFKGENIEWRPV